MEENQSQGLLAGRGDHRGCSPRSDGLVSRVLQLQIVAQDLSSGAGSRWIGHQDDCKAAGEHHPQHTLSRVGQAMQCQEQMILLTVIADTSTSSFQSRFAARISTYSGLRVGIGAFRLGQQVICIFLKPVHNLCYRWICGKKRRIS